MKRTAAAIGLIPGLWLTAKSAPPAVTVPVFMLVTVGAFFALASLRNLFGSRGRR